MWFICGLGNPGKKYQHTRHNIGFDFLDSIIANYDCILDKKDKSKEIFKGSILNNKCIFLKPLTYMNLCGPIIRDTINYYKIPKSKIMIIHDDLDLALGKIKIKTGGGNAGHNGLLSIDNNIGKNYTRIRIGIDRPLLKNTIPSFVLKKFNRNDRKFIEKKMEMFTKEFHLIFKDKAIFLNNLSINTK